MLVRSLYAPGELVDFTESLIRVPNQYGLFNNIGLFSNEFVANKTVEFEVIDENIGLVGDQPRGGLRNQVGKDYDRHTRSYTIPFFPYDDRIAPSDIAGKVAYGGIGNGEVETLAAVRLRKMQRLRQSHGQTLELARAKTITTGDIYAPNGTVVGNYYTDFAVTRKEIDFVLGTSATEVLLKQEEAIAHIQDNAFSGEIIEGFLCIASPEFFNKYITQAGVKAAYSQYSSSQEPLRNRNTGFGSRRVFTHGNITLVECRDIIAGVRLIPAGDAYFVPTGTTDVFKTYYAPSERFGLVNTVAVEQYMFEKGDDMEIKIQSESSFLNLIRKPQLVVRAYTSN